MRRADAIDAAVGDNMRVLRLSRKLSQGALASKIGISFQQLQKYEQGTNRISAGRLWRVAQFFEVPIHVLYNGVKGRLGNELSPVSLITDRDAMRLVQAFDKVQNRAARKAIVTLVEKIT